MPNAKIENPVRFVGWWRRDAASPWRPLVYNSDEDRAFNRLLDAALGGDKLVLPAGQDPNREGGS
jgi:hypothetical protein